MYHLILQFSSFQYFIPFSKGCDSCSNTNAFQSHYIRYTGLSQASKTSLWAGFLLPRHLNKQGLTGVRREIFSQAPVRPFLKLSFLIKLLFDNSALEAANKAWVEVKLNLTICHSSTLQLLNSVNWTSFCLIPL